MKAWWKRATRDWVILQFPCATCARWRSGKITGGLCTLTRRVDSHQLVGPHLTTAKRDARRPRGIEYVSVRIHHAPQSNGARVFGALEFDCAVRMPSTCAASINGSSSPADLTADLDHTSDEFKTIIQEHYRRTPSLRKLTDIHGVSRSTVHRIVQAQ